MLEPTLNTRNKNRYTKSFLYQTILLLILVITSSQSIAENVVKNITKNKTNRVATLPPDILNQLCRDLSPNKKTCGPDDQIHYIRSTTLDNDQVLLLFYLKDTVNRYHRSLTIPVKINSTGQWITGTTLVGEPHQILKHSLNNTQSLWMHAQFNKHGSMPILMHSKHGLDWISSILPQSKGASYLPTHIKQLCINNNDLFISLQTLDEADKTVTHYWKARITESNVEQLIWKTVPKNPFKTIHCNKPKPDNNAWLIQEGETMTLLLNNTNNLVIKVPHITTIQGELTPSSNKTSLTKKTTSPQKGFAIQVAAYSNPQLAEKTTQDLERNGFKSFIKTHDNNGKSLTRVYAGPYANKVNASANLITLKTKFSGTAIASGFIVTIK